MRFYLMLVIVLCLLGIAFIFGSQNHHTMPLNYLIAKTEISVAQAVSIFTLLGIAIGIAVTIMWRITRSFKYKKD